VGVIVGVGVIVIVDVGAAVYLGVGVAVMVGFGVRVEPNTCTGPQPETSRLSAMIYIAIAFLFDFIVPLRCHGHPRQLLKQVA
jgi:hypothetical protein